MRLSLEYQGLPRTQLTTTARLLLLLRPCAPCKWRIFKTVPFENLSIHAGQRLFWKMTPCLPRSLETGAAASAMKPTVCLPHCCALSAQRCDALSRSGECRRRVCPNFDHMALMVSLPVSSLVSPLVSSAQRWLVDVGFGDSFLEPLLLD